MPKTIHHSGWPVSRELCVVQMVKVTVQNTLINLRGPRPRQQRETKKTQPWTTRRSGWSVSGELCVLQEVEVTVKNTTEEPRGLRPQQHRAKATKLKTYDLKNSSQRPFRLRKAVRATGAASNRPEHTRKSGRPAPAATARNSKKGKNPSKWPRRLRYKVLIIHSSQSLVRAVPSGEACC